MSEPSVAAVLAADHVREEIEGYHRLTGRQRERCLDELIRLARELTSRRAGFVKAREFADLRIEETDLALKPILTFFAELEGWDEERHQQP